MERQLDIIAYLLARAIGKAENKTADEILKEAMDAIAPKKTPATKSKVDPEVVERIYKIYPTTCPVSGRSMGKCSKNKKQIETLLKTRTPEDIELTMREYIVDCKNHGTYLKNFGTLLNQFPDQKPAPQAGPTPPPTPEKASPEMIAIDAMHKGVTDTNLVRNAIVMVWDGITEDKIQHALWNAGYTI